MRNLTGIVVIIDISLIPICLTITFCSSETQQIAASLPVSVFEGLLPSPINPY
jgi:hypothetical protein